jgi:DNA-binding FrmR family transcriptional regulator
MEDVTPLIHRLNRAQGQIEAIKRKLQSDQELDCVKTIQQVKAANNALKRFAEAYVQEHLDQCLRKGVSKREMEKGLQEVIASAFDF